MLIPHRCSPAWDRETVSTTTTKHQCKILRLKCLLISSPLDALFKVLLYLNDRNGLSICFTYYVIFPIINTLSLTYFKEGHLLAPNRRMKEILSEYQVLGRALAAVCDVLNVVSKRYRYKPPTEIVCYPIVFL